MTGENRMTHLMLEALTEARKGKGRTYPNPAVGAVVARGGRIVGRGFHKRWGEPHAEVAALRDAGPRSRGADLYVTLEPCSHWGKTPPCTEAIIRSGIRRVIVPCIDPNPVVRGRGVRTLRRAGIEVVVGPCSQEARRLNEAYFKFMRTGIPFVTVKVAQTLDGKIATADGEARWVTSSAARQMGRQMRSEAQAILVGINTIRNDDPKLLPVPHTRTYYRCVLDTGLSIPLKSYVVRTARRHPTIVYCAADRGAKARRLEASGVKVRKMEESAPGLVDPEEVIRDLGRLDVMHLIVEGGGMVSSSFLEAGLVDRITAFVAPKVLGDGNGLGAFHKLDVKHLKDCHAFRIEDLSRVGDDALMVLYPKRRTGGS